MAIERLPVKEFLRLSKNNLLLDVRSPAEYAHAHIPSAISLPLLTDEERKLVGTAYKQQSRQQAIKIGLDIFAPKMRPIVETVESLISTATSTKENFDDIKRLQSNEPLTPNPLRSPYPPLAEERDKPLTLYLYCWRGGMRSAAIAWLLDLYGFKVYTLAGGYKSFRNHVLDVFHRPFQFKIVGGFTGSGKTEMLQELERLGERVIDLEQIASHKGSAFGSFKMGPQPTQEMFENLLAMELEQKTAKVTENKEATLNSDKIIWLEDESQRIGNINLPNAMWNTMRNTPVVFLEIDFEQRLRHLVEEYGNCDREKLADCVLRISKRLGPLETKNTVAYLQEDKIEDAFRILLHYYDKLYLKSLHNRENLPALLNRIGCETVTAENARLLTKFQTA